MTFIRMKVVLAMALALASFADAHKLMNRVQDSLEASPGSNLVSTAAAGTLAANPNAPGPGDDAPEPFTLADASAITAAGLSKMKDAILTDAAEKLMKKGEKYFQKLVPKKLAKNVENFLDAITSSLGDQFKNAQPVFDSFNSTMNAAMGYIQNGPLSRLMKEPMTCDAQIGLLQSTDFEKLNGANGIGAALAKINKCADDDGQESADNCKQAITFALGFGGGVGKPFSFWGTNTLGLAPNLGAGIAIHLGTVNGIGGGGGFGVKMAECDKGQCWDRLSGTCKQAPAEKGSSTKCYVINCPKCAEPYDLEAGDRSSISDENGDIEMTTFSTNVERQSSSSTDLERKSSSSGVEETKGSADPVERQSSSSTDLERKSSSSGVEETKGSADPVERQSSSSTDLERKSSSSGVEETKGAVDPDERASSESLSTESATGTNPEEQSLFDFGDWGDWTFQDILNYFTGGSLMETSRWRGGKSKVMGYEADDPYAYKPKGKFAKGFWISQRKPD